MKDSSISLIGKVVNSDKFVIKRNKQILINAKIDELKKAWQGTFTW